MRNHEGRHMRTLINYIAVMVVLVGALTMVDATRAAEPAPISGTNYLTAVELHVIPSLEDGMPAFAVEKVIGATTSPGWYSAMKQTEILSLTVDFKLGQGEAKELFVNYSEEGTISGSSLLDKVVFTVDEKTKLTKGTGEGTWEFTGGTGRYINVRGHGSYRTEFNSGTAVERWEGTVTGLEKHADLQ
jgi:hypothetical protein